MAKKSQWIPVSYSKKSTGKYYKFDTDHSNPFSVKETKNKIKARKKMLDDI